MTGSTIDSPDEALSKEYETIDTKFDNAKYDIVQAMCKSDCELAETLPIVRENIHELTVACYIKASSETEQGLTRPWTCFEHFTINQRI